MLHRQFHQHRGLGRAPEQPREPHSGARRVSTAPELAARLPGLGQAPWAAPVRSALAKSGLRRALRRSALVNWALRRAQTGSAALEESGHQIQALAR